MQSCLAQCECRWSGRAACSGGYRSWLGAAGLRPREDTANHLASSRGMGTVFQFPRFPSPALPILLPIPAIATRLAAKAACRSRRVPSYTAIEPTQRPNCRHVVAADGPANAPVGDGAGRCARLLDDMTRAIDRENAPERSERRGPSLHRTQGDHQNDDQPSGSIRSSRKRQAGAPRT